MDQEIFTAFMYRLQTDVRVCELCMHLDGLLQQAAPEESECCQYVCPGSQCLVLGDSQVGKTSLVRSLIGERFVTEQTKTQGIEERFVDNEWNTLEFTKGHAFGKFIPYFKKNVVGSLSSGRDGNVRLSGSTKLDFTAAVLVSSVYAGRFKGSLSRMLYYALHHIVLLMLSHLLSCTASPFVYRYKRSVACVFLVIHCVSLIRRTLEGIPRFVVIISLLAVMMTCYSTGISESPQFPGTIIVLSGVTNAILIGVAELPFFFFEFTVKRFQNHIKGTSPRPDQDKFEFAKIRRTLELFSLIISGFTGFSTTLVLFLFPKANNFQLAYALIHILATCLHILVTAESAFVLTEILKVPWSWKGLSVFVTLVILSFGLIFLPTTMYCAAIFASFSCSALFLECLLMYKITPVAADAECNILQLVDASGANGLLHNADLYWEKLKFIVYRKGKFLKLKVLDFVGDREYYSYHHIFLRPEALFIIVFNVSQFANEDFKDVHTHIQRLQFWMKSICSRVPSYTQIFLVGMHRGNRNDNCLKILNDHLKGFLSEKYCYINKLVRNGVDNLLFFPVENTLGNKDSGIQLLQRKIMSAAKEQQKRIIIEHTNIPLVWILIQYAIMNLKVSSDATFCVTLDELQTMIMDDFVLPDKYSLSKDMLKYFHEIGLIIYVDKKEDFDLSNWIILNPEKLINIFIQLSTKPTESTKSRGPMFDWDLLQSKGILTKALLQDLLSEVREDEEVIMAFLEHYGLICPLEYKKIAINTRLDCDLQPTHFVPSLLPLSTDGHVPVWHNNDGDKKFYVFFCNFLPEALFHQLLSRAQKNSTVEFPNGKTILYRDAGKFWMNPWLSYQLTLMEGEEMIEVTYKSSPKNKKEPSDVLCQVFSMIDGICKSYFPSVKFHCGPACPSETCPGHQDDYFTSLPTAEDNGTRRRHVYNIMPGRQGNRAAYLYCENNCFEDELYEWIP